MDCCLPRLAWFLKCTTYHKVNIFQQFYQTLSANLSGTCPHTGIWSLKSYAVHLSWHIFKSRFLTIQSVIQPSWVWPIVSVTVLFVCHSFCLELHADIKHVFCIKYLDKLLHFPQCIVPVISSVMNNPEITTIILD